MLKIKLHLSSKARIRSKAMCVAFAIASAFAEQLLPEATFFGEGFSVSRKLYANFANEVPAPK